jgi:hypothetical protein
MARAVHHVILGIAELAFDNETPDLTVRVPVVGDDSDFAGGHHDDAPLSH